MIVSEGIIKKASEQQQKSELRPKTALELIKQWQPNRYILSAHTRKRTRASKKIALRQRQKFYWSFFSPFCVSARHEQKSLFLAVHHIHMRRGNVSVERVQYILEHRRRLHFSARTNNFFPADFSQTKIKPFSWRAVMCWWPCEML